MIGWLGTSLKGLARRPLRSRAGASGEGREARLREQPRGRGKTLGDCAPRARAGLPRGREAPRRPRARRRKVRRTPRCARLGQGRGGRGGRGLERRCGAGGGTKASAQPIGRRPDVARDAPRGEGARAFSGLFVWCPGRGAEVAAAATLVGFQRPRLALGPPARPFPPPPAPLPAGSGGGGDDGGGRARALTAEASATANGDGDAAERAGRGQGPGGRHGELAAL